MSNLFVFVCVWYIFWFNFAASGFGLEWKGVSESHNFQTSLNRFFIKHGSVYMYIKNYVSLVHVNRRK